jgi:integrase
MRGHIVKRKRPLKTKPRYTDNWSIVIELGYDPLAKKRRQQWFSFRGTKKEAERRLTELLHELDNGTFVQPDKTTLGEYLSQWMKDHEQNLAPRSFERYQSVVKKDIAPVLGNITLAQLRPEHLQRYYTSQLEKDRSPATVRYSHSVIHVALKEAVKLGILSRNVADAVDPPRVKNKEMSTWEEDDINHFLEVIRDSAYYELFYTALYTGMRRSELLGLRWGDVDKEFFQISVRRGLHQLEDGSYVFTEPKSAKSRRTIALTPSNASVLREYREKQKQQCTMLGKQFTDDDLVFCHFDGKPLRPNSVTRAWQTLAGKAGLKVIRLHDARHSHASLMLKQRIHPKVVQERLGHSSIQITLDRYSHVAEGLQEAAAARFDEGLQVNKSGALAFR